MKTSIREFTNEVGNPILIEVSTGVHLCKFAVMGPDSSLEGYVTRMELEQLRDALNEVFS